MFAHPALLSGQQRQQGAAVHLSHQQLRHTKKKQSSWKHNSSALEEKHTQNNKWWIPKGRRVRTEAVICSHILITLLIWLNHSTHSVTKMRACVLLLCLIFDSQRSQTEEKWRIEWGNGAVGQINCLPAHFLLNLWHTCLKVCTDVGWHVTQCWCKTRRKHRGNAFCDTTILINELN